MNHQSFDSVSPASPNAGNLGDCMIFLCICTSVVLKNFSEKVKVMIKIILKKNYDENIWKDLKK